MLTYILLIIGFYALIKGADLLVDGASSIAKKYNVSDIVIGLTIVAFGTSLPELFVNLFASFNGNTDIAIGNIVGSNIANILLILGICAIIHPISVLRSTIWKEIPLGLLGVVLLFVFANDMWIDGGVTNMLSRSDGIALLGFFVIFLYYTFGMAKDNPDLQDDEVSDESSQPRSMLVSVGMILVGLVGLTVGGKWIIDGAIQIATMLGLSQALIGLTIVAIGTSLPELATSAVAALKGKADIAIGNIAGSNIFNIFWILGLSSVINPLPFNPILNVDIGMAIIASFLLFSALFLGKKAKLERSQGIFFVLIYVAYMAYLIVRG